jgi:hypothetical protein
VLHQIVWDRFLEWELNGTLYSFIVCEFLLERFIACRERIQGEMLFPASEEHEMLAIEVEGKSMSPSGIALLTESEMVRRGLKTPAGRAVGFVRAQTEDGHRNDFVDFIWRWTCAWRSVIGVEDSITHRGVPSLHRIGVGYLLEPGFVAYLRGFSLDNQIES